MRIIVVASNVGESQIIINGNGVKKVSELPQGLQSKMAALLSSFSLALPKITEINIAGNVEDALLRRGDENITPASLGSAVKSDFLEITELLKWYLNPHWTGWGQAGVIGGPVQCVDCGYSKPVGASGKYCSNPDCSSHAKWRQVIGPSYQPPEGAISVFLSIPEGDFTP